MSEPDVSAVVVAWNAGETLRSCIESLRVASRRADIELEVVVVDNASSDGAPEEIRAEADVLIHNPVNAGFGVAASQGLARTRASWVLLVNPDVVVDEAFFMHLLPVAVDAPSAVAALVPEMRFDGADAVLNCRGITVDDLGIPAEIDAGLPIQTPRSAGQPLGGSSGCCLLRRSTLEELGGLEPVFFAYLEDVDLALRLARRGSRAVLVQEAVAFHGGSTAAGVTSKLKTFLVARNRRLLFRLEGQQGARVRVARAGVEVAHGAASSVVSSSLAPWRGRADALRLRRYVRFVRRARRTYDIRSSAPPLTRRPSLAAALRRKRALIRAAKSHRAGVWTKPANHD